MKLSIKGIVVFLFICFAYQNLHAQETEKRSALIRLAYTKRINADTVLAFILIGKNHGVEKGLTGPVKGVYKSQDDRNDLELGFGSVINVSDTTALIFIRPKDTSGKKPNDIRLGDNIKLNLTIPKIKNRSIFFDLALLDIDFYNAEKEKMYDFYKLFTIDGKKIEDSLLQISKNDVYDTYELVKDEKDEKFNSLFTPLTEGRYKGRTVMDVMKNVSEVDVKTFLNFIIGYPGKYIGNSWKINETFATWVLNNAPYNKNEFYDSVMAYKDQPKKLQQFIEKNRSLFIKDEYIRDWVSNAVDARDLNDKAKLDNYLLASKITLPYLNDDRSSGYYYYILAQFAQDDDKFELAIKMCDTATSYFTKAEDIKLTAEVIMKKAYCLQQLKRYDESIIAYKKIPALVSQTSATFTKEQQTAVLKKYYSFIGYAYYFKGDYLPALENLKKAITYNIEINTYESRKELNNVQGVITKIYKSQGEYALANENFQEQLKNAIYIGDKEKEASLRDEIGFIQSKLGNYNLAIEFHRSAIINHLFFVDNSSVGYSFSQIGQSQWNLGNYDSAIYYHFKAMEYRRKADDNSGLAYSWKKLGTLYNLVGKKDDALKAYDSTAYFYGLDKDSANLISNYIDVGEVYENDKQYQKAYTYYVKAHQINKKRKLKADILNSQMKIAGATYFFNKDSAQILYKEALVMANEIGSKTDALYANLNLGMLTFRNYEFDLGKKYFSEAVKYCIEEKNKSEEAYAYNKIGIAMRGKLEFAEALNYFNKALFIYDSLGAKASIPEIQQSLANTYFSMGDFEKSITLFNRSIDLATENKNMAEVGEALNSLSFINLIRGNIPRSLAMADSTILIFGQLKNNWQMANAYITKGNVHNELNDYKQAVYFYLQADSLYKIEKDSISRSTTQNNIGSVYFYQSDYSNALTYFFESEKILNKIKVITESHALAKLNIGEVYYHQKNYKLAEEYLLQAFKMASEKKLIRYINSGNLILGKLYFDLKNYTEAGKRLQEAYKVSATLSENAQNIESAIFLGKLYDEQQKNEDAKKYFQFAINKCEQTGYNKLLWEAYYEMGLQFYKTNAFDSSIHYLKLAARSSEKIADDLFGGSEAKKLYNADARRVDIYNKLVASLVKVDKASEALYYADRGNSQGVKEKLEQSGIKITDETKKVALEKSAELLKKQNAIEQAIAKEKSKPENERNLKLISSLESVQEVAKKDYINFINDLVKNYPDLQSYFSATNPRDFNNYIDYIPDSAIVVLYVINEDQLLIFTVTNKTTGIKTVKLTGNLNEQATKFIALLKNPKIASGTKPINVRSSIQSARKAVDGDFRLEAAGLYDLLITPIAEELKDKNLLCVIPNGKLSNIPFQSLGHFEDNKNFRFLVEDINIFYTNKMDVFIKPFKSSSITSSFVAMGNPDKSLPKATSEVQSISNIIANTKLYIEDDATETIAKSSLENFKYVHFATHGVLDYNDFQKSFLLFKKSDGENGQLTIEEINGLSISGCDLVTLSACETAVSQEAVKGWYISPANSFLVNRVKSVVASLWQVDDDATSILMTDFYKNVKTMPKAVALRKAQETLSKTEGYSHPYFWSAFVLYGDWR